MRARSSPWNRTGSGAAWAPGPRYRERTKDAERPLEVTAEGRGESAARAARRGPAAPDERGSYYVECPHCGGMVEIAHVDINCGIFRHHPRLRPHASEEESARAVQAGGDRHGCGKPFSFDGREARRASWES